MGMFHKISSFLFTFGIIIIPIFKIIVKSVPLILDNYSILYRDITVNRFLTFFEYFFSWAKLLLITATKRNCTARDLYTAL